MSQAYISLCMEFQANTEPLPQKTKTNKQACKNKTKQKNKNKAICDNMLITPAFGRQKQKN